MSARLRVQPQGAPLHGSVPVPSDRSITHRALILAALSNGACELRGFGYASDNLATLRALRALGVGYDDDGAGTLHVRGVGLSGLRGASEPIDVGASAACLRLLTGMLAGQAFDSTLTGAGSLERQPLLSLVAPLVRRGARIEARPSPHRAGDLTVPLVITGLPASERLGGLEYGLRGPNEDVKGALLFSGLFASAPTVVLEPVISSDHTERLLDALGMPVRTAGAMISLHPPADPLAIRHFELDVPGDLSAAAYLHVAAQIIPGSNVTTRRTGLNPTRAAVLELIRLCGGSMGISPAGESVGEPFGDVSSRGSSLRGIGVGGELAYRAQGELAPLCVLGSRARGTTEISDCAELESEQPGHVQGLVELLRAFGVPAEARTDGLVLEGNPEAPLRAGRVSSGGDYRIAMAAVLLGLAADGESIIDDADCIAVSFPRFVGTLRALGASIEVMR